MKDEKDGADEGQTVRDSIIAAMEKHNEVETKTAESDAPAIDAPTTEQRDNEADSKPTKKAKIQQQTDTTDVVGAEQGEGEEHESEVSSNEPDNLESIDDKRPPQALSAVIKAKWSDIPDDVKNEFIRLEQASAKGVTSLKQDAQIGRTLMDEIRPYEGLIKAAGGTPQTTVRNLLQTAAILRTGTPAQKQNAVLSIMQEYGIQLNGQEPAYEDPYLREINQLKQQLMQQQQTRQTQQDNEVLSIVESFLGETDERGNPKYPLDDRLEAEFADEIASVKRGNPSLNERKVLETAYERMSWKVPEIRQTLLERQQAELEAKRKEKQAQEVAKKKEAGVSVKGTGSSTVPSSDLTLRQMLEQQIYGTGNRI